MAKRYHGGAWKGEYCFSRDRHVLAMDDVGRTINLQKVIDNGNSPVRQFLGAFSDGGRIHGDFVPPFRQAQCEIPDNDLRTGAHP